MESTTKMLQFMKHAESMDWPGPESRKWNYTSVETSGSYSFTKMGNKEQVNGTIASGLNTLHSNPGKYIGCMYQSLSLIHI